MAVALTWWGWSGLVASVGVILALWARHAWRAAVRQELVDHLARAAPEIEILDARAGVLVYRCGTAPERRYPLGDFYRRVAGHPGGSAEAEASRLEVFAAAAIAMRLHGVGDAAIGPVTGEGLRRASCDARRLGLLDGRRQLRRAHQVGVDAARRAAAVRDRPHDE